jgi:hypothetical protein
VVGVEIAFRASNHWYSLGGFVMSLSRMLSKIGGTVAVMGVVFATLFGVGSAAAATTTCVASQLPAGCYCGDGHPWHN